MQDKKINIVLKKLNKFVSKFRLPLGETIKNKHKYAFHVLVSTILSAQTKDTLNERVLPILFKKVKNFKDLEKISLSDLQSIIRPINYYKNKSKYLKALPSAIKEFKGKVPDNIDDLVKLPGVGRKTANLVVGLVFDKDSICVDTHVHRICNRLGYVETKTPLQTEMALRKKLPKKWWKDINRILVMFGQNHCFPRNPKCKTCPVRMYCKYKKEKSY